MLALTLRVSLTALTVNCASTGQTMFKVFGLYVNTVAVYAAFTPQDISQLWLLLTRTVHILVFDFCIRLGKCSGKIALVYL